MLVAFVVVFEFCVPFMRICFLGYYFLAPFVPMVKVYVLQDCKYDRRYVRDALRGYDNVGAWLCIADEGCNIGPYYGLAQDGRVRNRLSWLPFLDLQIILQIFMYIFLTQSTTRTIRKKRNMLGQFATNPDECLCKRD